MTQSAWMISRGEYSDYRVEAVFLDKAEAEAFAKRWNEDYDLRGGDEYGVEEVALRPELPEPGIYCFRTYIKRDGGIVDCSKHEYGARGGFSATVIQHGYAGPGWNVHCFARDKEHAMKIASEYRQAELAKASVLPGLGTEDK
jgi:hypothetical protein